MLRQAGAAVLVDNRDLAVVGVVEVLRCARAIYRGFKTIRAHFLENRPDVVVLIDFPDFNFILGRLAKRLGTKVFYYISPQVWAWRSGRVRSLRRFVDRMAVILPFETLFYHRHRLEVHHVGHPLLDVMGTCRPKEEALSRYRSTVQGRLVGLLPGSRGSEVGVLLPLLLETASRLEGEIPDLSFILPVAPVLDADAIKDEIARHGLRIEVVAGDTYGVIQACDLIITASGTVTLEAAILGTPMIVIYKVSSISGFVGRHLIRVKHAGLPNLIAGREIVPELLQENARADIIAAEATSLLRHPERLDKQREELGRIQKCLGQPGVADRVAGMILELASSV
jgi:lipid-A-disaccharide synthase